MTFAIPINTIGQRFGRATLRFVSILCHLVSLAIVPAAQAAEAPISLKDANAFVRQLGEMGYAPGQLDTSGTPTVLIQTNGSSYGVVLGGCTGVNDCRYIVLFGRFTDVINPPAEWLVKKNSQYDLIKLWLDDDKVLVYSTSMVAEGMPRSVLRATIDMFTSSEAALANDIINDKIRLTGSAPPKR